MMSTTTKSVHAQTKKPRRSHRPIHAKAPKAARVAAQSTAKVVADVKTQSRVQTGRLKLLEKLLARHEGAGRTEAAEETRSQIEDLQREMRMLEQDVKAMQATDATMAE